MPRRARIVLPDVTLHLIQRGNNRQACFYYTADYRNYLDWLQEYACQCAWLLPLHRTESREGGYGRTPCELPLVELPGECSE
jgi:putative transposase